MGRIIARLVPLVPNFLASIGVYTCFIDGFLSARLIKWRIHREHRSAADCWNSSLSVVQCSGKLNLDFLDGESITVNRTTRRRLSMTVLLFVSFMHLALHFLTRLRINDSTNRNRSNRNISRIRRETSRDNFFGNYIIQILCSKRFFFFLFKTRLKEGKI